MEGVVRVFSLLILLLLIWPGSSAGTSNTPDPSPGMIRSWCDDHPDWNLCTPRDRHDPSEIIDHDLSVYTPPESTGPRIISRLDRCGQIVRAYNATHIYEKHSYDCDDMTLDIWNQLKKEYINAKIGLGNVTDPVANLWESSHAWVIAEYEPDRWVALEGVEGRLVYKDENPLYYTGWFFDTPLEYKKYREYLIRLQDEIEDMNRLAGEITLSYLNDDDRKVKEYILADHARKRQDLETKIIALSQGVRVSHLDLFANSSTAESS